MKYIKKPEPALVRRVIFCTHKARRIEMKSRWQCHACYGHELIYVDYGTMRVHLEEENKLVHPGECMFIRGGTRHMFESHTGTPYSYLNAMFRGALLPQLYGQALKVGPYGLTLMERMTREVVTVLPYHYESVVCCLTELIIHLLRQLAIPQTSWPPEPAYLRHSHSETVRRTLTLIQRHYAEALTLRQTSRAVGVSESYLHVLLKKETGATFTQHLQRRRIATAKQLLLESSMALPEIADAVGYKSISFFFNFFKRIVGMTPAQFARTLGEPTARG